MTTQYNDFDIVLLRCPSLASANATALEINRVFYGNVYMELLANSC